MLHRCPECLIGTMVLAFLLIVAFSSQVCSESICTTILSTELGCECNYTGSMNKRTGNMGIKQCVMQILTALTFTYIPHLA